MALLKDHHMEDVLVILGGIIPDSDIPQMKALGVAEIFQPGASLDHIVEFIRARVESTRGRTSERA
jgi:methylmalonyl-CoA mutase C-terminal domain/subunit